MLLQSNFITECYISFNLFFWQADTFGGNIYFAGDDTSWFWLSHVTNWCIFALCWPSIPRMRVWLHRMSAAYTRCVRVRAVLKVLLVTMLMVRTWVRSAVTNGPPIERGRREVLVTNLLWGCVTRESFWASYNKGKGGRKVHNILCASALEHLPSPRRGGDGCRYKYIYIYICKDLYIYNICIYINWLLSMKVGFLAYFSGWYLFFRHFHWNFKSFIIFFAVILSVWNVTFVGCNLRLKYCFFFRACVPYKLSVLS